MSACGQKGPSLLIRLYGRAYRAAAERGLTGDDAAAFTTNIITQAKALRDDIKLPAEQTRVDRQLAKEIHEEAMKTSLDRTWKGQFYGETGQAFDKLINQSPGGKTLKLLGNQFFSTPARIMTWAGQRNLVTTWFSKQMRDDLSGVNGTRAKDLAQAKLIVGTAAQLTAYTLVKGGFLTAQAPKEQKNEYRDAHVLDFAINLNGKLYQINQVDPYGSFLTNMAALMYAKENTKNDDWQEQASAMFGATLNDWLGRSYLKGIFDLKQAVTDETGKGAVKYLQQYGASLVPMSGIAKWGQDVFGDDTVRKADGINDEFLKVYAPWMLRPDLDSYGKEQHSPDRLLQLRTSTQDFSSARMEVVKLGVHLPQAPDVIGQGQGTGYGYVLTPEDRYNYMKSLSDPSKGINMEQRLQEVVDRPNYKQLDPEVQQMLLQKVVTLSHRAAQAEILKETPQAIDAIKNRADGLREMYTNHQSLDFKGNWLQFLTGRKAEERDIMNAHGVFKAP